MKQNLAPITLALLAILAEFFIERFFPAKISIEGITVRVII